MSITLCDRSEFNHKNSVELIQDFRCKDATRIVFEPLQTRVRRRGYDEKEPLVPLR